MPPPTRPVVPTTGTGFRTRLRITTLLVATAFLALAFFQAAERQRVEREKAAEQVERLAQIGAASLDDAIIQARTLLQSLAINVDPTRAPALNDAVLRQVYGTIPSTFGNLIVLDSTGRNVGAAVLPRGGRSLLDLGDRPYIKAARKTGQFTLGLSVKSRSAEGAPWIIPAVQPVRDAATGALRAFMIASLRVDSLEVMRLRRQLPEGSVITIIDSNAVIVARSTDPDVWNTRRFPGIPDTGSTLKPLPADSVVLSPIDAQKRLMGSEMLRAAPWKLYIGMPTDVVFAPSRQQFRNDLLLALVVSTGIALLGWWLTSRLVAPIEQLTADAQRIAGGDLTRRSAISSRDEVGMLAQSFNEMADALVQRSELLSESQRQLQQSQKLEALGAFAGGMAHDFNNYLYTIQGHAELALDHLPPSNPARDEVTSVLAAAKRAAELTRGILSFTGRQVTTTTSFGVNSAIADLHRLIERLLGPDILYRFAPDHRVSGIHMDIGQFEQVLVNLAANARDAMGGRGAFTVSTRLDVHEDGTPTAVVVADDTGPGVPSTIRSRVFEPFFTTKDRGRGTGLGLSISYGIISNAGGRLVITDAPGGGARFEIHLPAHDIAAVAVDQLPEPLAYGKGERLLIVDDDASVGLVAERVLQRAGYSVERVDSAASALQRLADTRYELLITDVVMPEMSGPRLVHEALMLHGPMRLLFMSGYPDDDLLSDALDQPHSAFVAKPFSRESLLRTVRTLLDTPVPAGD